MDSDFPPCVNAFGGSVSSGVLLNLEPPTNVNDSLTLRVGAVKQVHDSCKVPVVRKLIATGV